MLPFLVEVIFKRMDAEGLLSERKQKFFTDKRLNKFWGKVSNYLSDVQADYRENAAAMLTGGFLNPISFGYGEAGTAEQPTRKNLIGSAQNKADPVIKRIAKLAGELADALEELEGITRYHPDETRLLSIVRPLVDATDLNKLPTYYEGVRTSDALRILQTKFEDYPNARDPFKDVPGMTSQKASWADWMREAESNLTETLDVYPGSLSLRESDWLSLAKVLIGEHVSREAVQAARRNCNAQPE